MKAIILCAGYATRLYPLTLNTPKALLEIKRKPLLSYIVEKIPKKINEIVVVSNDKFYNNFVKWAQKYKGKIKVLNDGTTSNENRLGGIGDLYFAIKKENIRDDILVILGDNLFDFNLDDFINFFKKNKKTLVGVYEFPSEELKKLGVVKVEGNKIISFEEKPEKPRSNLASTGVYIFTNNDLNVIENYMKTENNKDGPGYLIKYFYSIQDVHTFTFKGRWFDIGSLEMYEKVNKEWNN